MEAYEDKGTFPQTFEVGVDHTQGQTGRLRHTWQIAGGNPVLGPSRADLGGRNRLGSYEVVRVAFRVESAEADLDWRLMRGCHRFV